MTAAEFRELVYNDFEAFCELCLVVEDKMTLAHVPMRLKPVQRRLARTIIERYEAGEPVRIIILKARREGVSTILQALLFWLCSTRRFQKSITIAHDDDGTQTLHSMSERFYDDLPELIRPMRRTHQVGKVLEFANPTAKTTVRKSQPGLRSEMRTVSRKNAAAAKGTKFFHGSEVAKWGSDAKVTLSTALQTIPRAPYTIVALEGTAQGVGNEFANLWDQAEQGESDYIPFFIPWFEEPTNVAPAPDGFEPDTDEERVLVKQHGLAKDQLWWRRLTIANECGGDIDTFHQEYPASAQEAFLTSGRPYFSQAALLEHAAQTRDAKPVAVGDLLEKSHEVTFAAHKRGAFTVWELPKAGEDYLIFCDSSEGSGQDPQAFYVSPRSRLEIVAAWHGRVERDELGDHLLRAGYVYNTALIAVEITGGWGMTPVMVLKRRHYPRIYQRRVEDRRTKKRKLQLGFQTTPVTRALMLDALSAAIRTFDIKINDPRLVHECQRFVYDDNGKPQAQQGFHDDCVIAGGGLCHLWHTEPRRAPPAPRRSQHEVLSPITGY